MKSQFKMKNYHQKNCLQNNKSEQIKLFKGIENQLNNQIKSFTTIGKSFYQNSFNKYN